MMQFCLYDGKANVGYTGLAVMRFYWLSHVDMIHTRLECGPMPNVMVALLNIGGALCSTPQSFW